MGDVESGYDGNVFGVEYFFVGMDFMYFVVEMMGCMGQGIVFFFWVGN